ncbi:DNA/RNA non-specific endonuclease [Cupriavidus sp. SW-Y-13]|uniref:DNA/RNA non-specific endonuclease n=1 Tax=Cupriavidus sp. SW-Y-13 TaxID=2653854 RepID=UPI0021025F84|nr:DNA/RNA non-specific endonuclease [Cupriavidus sp. SW-Y-13]
MIEATLPRAVTSPIRHRRPKASASPKSLPQNSPSNRRTWSHIETSTRKLARQYGTIHVVTGPAFTRAARTLNGRVRIRASVPQPTSSATMRRRRTASSASANCRQSVARHWICHRPPRIRGKRLLGVLHLPGSLGARKQATLLPGNPPGWFSIRERWQHTCWPTPDSIHREGTCSFQKGRKARLLTRLSQGNGGPCHESAQHPGREADRTTTG